MSFRVPGMLAAVALAVAFLVWPRGGAPRLGQATETPTPSPVPAAAQGAGPTAATRVTRPRPCRSPRWARRR